MTIHHLLCVCDLFILRCKNSTKQNGSTNVHNRTIFSQRFQGKVLTTFYKCIPFLMFKGAVCKKNKNPSLN